MRLEIHSKASLFHFVALSERESAIHYFLPHFSHFRTAEQNTHTFRVTKIWLIYLTQFRLCVSAASKIVWNQQKTAFWWCSKCIMIYLLFLSLSLALPLPHSGIIAYLCMGIIHIWPFILWHKYTWCYMQQHTTPTANRTNQLMAPKILDVALAPKRKCNS